MRVLGLDVGEKRIGVARGDLETRIAVPVGYVVRDGSEWEKIRQLARIYSTDSFVLGLPRSNEGSETKQSLYARNFAKELAGEVPGAKIAFQDESLTSVVAEERLKARKKPYEKGDIDAEAASVILQDYLETPQSVTPEKKNGKKKSKKWLKWVSGVAILVILGLLATGVALWIREERYKEYARQFAEIEAGMEADVFSYTILPGQTIYDIRVGLIRAGYSETEVNEALTADYGFGFLAEPRAKAIERGNLGNYLEGYLYGETHEFYGDTSAKEVIKTFLQGMEKVITENNLEARYAEQGLTLYEGVTLASIVQKEAPTPEMPTVAQVFLTRLAYGIALGSDVTVSYALDTVDPDRQTYSDNQAALTVNSCYNTRVNRGLPCGPISNPGLSALLAVANPSDTAYLYFLTGDDGLMYYSYTEAEHNQNAYAHCQNLCNISL